MKAVDLSELKVLRDNYAGSPGHHARHTRRALDAAIEELTHLRKEVATAGQYTEAHQQLDDLAREKVEAAEATIQSRDAEIERLKGTLREAEPFVRDRGLAGLNGTTRERLAERICAQALSTKTGEAGGALHKPTASFETARCAAQCARVQATRSTGASNMSLSAPVEGEVKEKVAQARVEFEALDGEPHRMSSEWAEKWGAFLLDQALSPRPDVGPGRDGPHDVLLLASYCGDDNPACSDLRPCQDCLSMSNVFSVDRLGPYRRELGREGSAPSSPSEGV